MFDIIISICAYIVVHAIVALLLLHGLELVIYDLTDNNISISKNIRIILVIMSILFPFVMFFIIIPILLINLLILVSKDVIYNIVNL